MRQQIIQRIFDRIGEPGEQRFNNMRWMAVAEQICTIQGGNPETKAFKKSLGTIQYLENDFTEMTDEQLTNLFELVIARFYTQM